MSSIGSLSGMSGNMMMQGMQTRQRPDPAQMAENLFSKLDSSGQGYIEKADLQSAMSGVNSGGATDAADELFAQLDSDSDGKVTQQEFSDVLTRMAEQLDQQFSDMRMNQAMQAGGMQGMQGRPPPPANDSGFTKDELSSQLKEIGSTDSGRSSMISSIVENFEAADTDSDGKVSFREAMSFEQSQRSETEATGSSTSASAGTDDSSRLMMQIMRLMEAYDIGGEWEGKRESLLSVTA